MRVTGRPLGGFWAWSQGRPVGSSCPCHEAATGAQASKALLARTVHTAVCRMASKPPSGASRLPEIRSPCSLSLNSSTSSVRLMTFLKEKGGSLLGQGSFSLGEVGERKTGRGKPYANQCLPPISTSGELQVPAGKEASHLPTRGPLGHSLLRPHVRLRDADFVHKLAKSNSVVAGELTQDCGWASAGERGDG